MTAEIVTFGELLGSTPATGPQPTAVPARWTEIINKIRRRFPEAVIAGGAIRELLNGKLDLVKDIDVFVRGNGDDQTYEMVCDALGYGGDTEFGAATIAEYTGWQPEINALYEFTYFEPGEYIEWIKIDPTIQITVMNWGEMSSQQFVDKLTNNFDIGLCRAWYDGKNVHVTGAYVCDHLGKKLTVLKHEPDRTAKRLQRLIRKYPDHIVDYTPIAPDQGSNFDLIEDTL